MPGSGICMLRQLFHEPGIMASFSPEPLNSDGRKGGYRTPGLEVRPEIAKSSPIQV
jgi:hypothetical protein